MTAVSMLAVSLGTPPDGEASGRTSGDSGSLFGDALTTAGQMLAGSESESATPREAAGESEAAPVDGRPAAASASGLDLDAASTALLQLAAHLRPPVPGEDPPAESGVPDGVSDDPTPAVVAGVDISTPPAPEAAQAPVSASMPPEGDRVPTAAGPMPPAATVPVDGPDGGEGSAVAASSAPAPASSASAPAAAGTQLSSGPLSPGGEPAVRPAPVPAPDRVVPSSAFAGAGSPSAATPSSNESAVRIESSDRVASASSALTAPSATPVIPPQTSVTAAAPVPTPETAPANRAVAAQVSPVVVSIAQRPMGTHQLTMTVNPDSLGPVTVRAHISASGEVQVELSGATDAGRDALRGILVDLRRDLAAVMPHASLSVTQSSAADATTGDRSGQGADDAAARDQSSGDRDGSRGRSEPRPGAERAADLPRIIQTTPHAGVGAGLDIFA